MTAYDNSSLYNTSSIDTTVNELLALNSSDVIEYSRITPNTNSTQDSNVTIYNLGNTMIDLNLYGYGEAQGDNLAMKCDIGNITIEKQKFNLTSANSDYSYSMSSLANLSNAQTFTGFNLAKAKSTAGSSAIIYWKIGIPKFIRGACNGTVVFGAVKS